MVNNLKQSNKNLNNQIFYKEKETNALNKLKQEDIKLEQF